MKSWHKIKIPYFSPRKVGMSITMNPSFDDGWVTLQTYPHALPGEQDRYLLEVATLETYVGQDLPLNQVMRESPESFRIVLDEP